MGISSDSADQIVKVAIDGTEVLLRLSGTLAKNVAVMLYAMLKDSHENSGKVQLKQLIKENRNITFFEVPKEQLKDFAKEAKRYGLTYTAVREKNGSGPVELMVRADDATRVNRIAERLRLATVDISRETQLDKDKPEDPMRARTVRNANLSEPFSSRSPSAGRDDNREKKPDVRVKLKEIQKALRENANTPDKTPELPKVKIPERQGR